MFNCLSSSHRTASDTNYWMNRHLYIAVTTLYLGQFQFALDFSVIQNVPVDFFEFLSTEFEIIGDNHRKALY